MTCTGGAKLKVFEVERRTVAPTSGKNSLVLSKGDHVISFNSDEWAVFIQYFAKADKLISKASGFRQSGCGKAACTELFVRKDSSLYGAAKVLFATHHGLRVDCLRFDPSAFEALVLIVVKPVDLHGSNARRVITRLLRLVDNPNNRMPLSLNRPEDGGEEDYIRSEEQPDGTKLVWVGLSPDNAGHFVGKGGWRAKLLNRVFGSAGIWFQLEGNSIPLSDGQVASQRPPSADKAAPPVRKVKRPRKMTLRRKMELASQTS